LGCSQTIDSHRLEKHQVGKVI